jgi:hypothetical protein
MKGKGKGEKGKGKGERREGRNEGKRRGKMGSFFGPSRFTT